MVNVLRVIIVEMMVGFLCVGTGSADIGTDDSTVALTKVVEALQDQIAALEGEVGDLRAKVNAPQSASKDTVLVQAKSAIKVLEDEVAALRSQREQAIAKPQVLTTSDVKVPSWVAGTRFSGDVRVRFQSDFAQGTAPGTETAQYDRNRLRVRLRYGITKQLNDELMAAFRIATGPQGREFYYATAGNTSSYNNNMFGKLDVWIDQLYLKYSPNWLENLAVYAGKFPHNWKDKGFLLDANGCGFEGLGESYVYNISDDIGLDVNLAQLVVSEAAGTTALEEGDSELFVFDAGIGGTYETDATPLIWGLRSTVYYFNGYRDGGDLLNLNSTGNSATLSNPVVLVGTADVGFTVADIPVSFFAQGALNINENINEGDTEETVSSIEDQNKFYALGIDINKLKQAGDWTLFYTFAYLQRNVMPAAVPDSDLYPTSASARAYHNMGVTYRLFDSTDLNVTIIVPRSIEADRDSDTVITKWQVTTRF